jgi:hypothetical protein
MPYFIHGKFEEKGPFRDYKTAKRKRRSLQEEHPEAYCVMKDRFGVVRWVEPLRPGGTGGA